MALIGFIVAGLVGWVITGYLAGAYMFAYAQREFALIAESERASDKRIATYLCCFGPVGLAGMVLGTTLWGLINWRGIYHGLDFGWPWA